MTKRQEEWFNGAIGRSMNLDAVAGLQCVDVPNDYAEYIFGNWEKTMGRGDARQKFFIAPSEYWDKIYYAKGLIPQRGDVIVWPGSTVVPEGHTAVISSSGPVVISVIEQNGYKQGPAYATTHPYVVNRVQPTGWLRPRPEKISGGNEVTNEECAKKEVRLLADVIEGRPHYEEEDPNGFMGHVNRILNSKDPLEDRKVGHDFMNNYKAAHPDQTDEEVRMHILDAQEELDKALA